MSDVKVNNRSLILKQLKYKKRSRKDIAEKIKLTPAAVTILVNELIEQGCIRESGHVDEPSRVGRKKVFLELHNTYKYAIGVNIEGDDVSIGIGDLSGNLLQNINKSIDGLKAIEVLNIIVQNIMDLIWNMNLSKKDILGIGIGIVGIVDNQNGISKRAYGLWKEEVKVREILEQELGLPVIVENNVRALARAEMEQRTHKKMDNMVFVKHGPGIGSAIMLNKEIYRGSNNKSGELGHMVIDPNGEECRCGKKGCLETIASVKSVIKKISKEYNEKDYPILYEITKGDMSLITEETILNAYIKGDKKVTKYIENMLQYLAIGLVNTMKFYDPHKIIIYGKLFEEDIFIEKLIAYIEENEPMQEIAERIEKSSLNAPKSIGGLVMIVDELFFNKGATIIHGE